MSNITKPVDINKIWSASGDILAPSDTKISQGWAIEIPARQHFNYIDNKQDASIAHINQHGIAVWDALTEYQANTSYTQGSNGVVYKCLITNTNINPVGDTTNSWRVAFLDSTAATGPIVATATQSRAMTDNSVFLSPLQLANAFTGTHQNLATPSGFQDLPGGLILQWTTFNLLSITASGTQLNISWPKAFPSLIIGTFYTPDTNPNAVYQLSVINKTLTGASVFCAAYPAGGWGLAGTNIVFALGK